MPVESAAQAQLTLARDLVDDIELSRLAPEQLLLKALRLARFVRDEAAIEWLNYELNGYPNTPAAAAWMRRFGRFTNEELAFGYWLPLAGISGTIASTQTQIQAIQVPGVQLSLSSANPNEFVGGLGQVARGIAEPTEKVLKHLAGLTGVVSTLSSLRSRVLAAIHEFAVGHHHRLAFSGLAETIFDRHRSAVDLLIQGAAPEVLEKLPAVYDRLSAGDKESVSQAMNSVRRMIKVFADSVYPPEKKPVSVDGKKYEVGSDKVLNRIELYLRGSCTSASRRDRLKRSLRDVYDRASAGSHADITPQEARSLFLAGYLTLGEILEAGSA